jgi:4-hydroxyphenylacetate 3-monooxygenase
MLDSTKGRGIRTGAQYLAGLRDDREVWTGGKRVRDVTTEPGLHRGAKTLAGFLDHQHETQYREATTYLDEDGDRCGLAFKIPKSKEDVIARGRAFTEWAKWSHGMYGRTPDYKNASMAALAGATDFLAQGTKGQADFAANMTAFYTNCRKNDLVLTHT